MNGNRAWIEGCVEGLTSIIDEISVSSTFFIYVFLSGHISMLLFNLIALSPLKNIDPPTKCRITFNEKSSLFKQSVDLIAVT